MGQQYKNYAGFGFVDPFSDPVADAIAAAAAAAAAADRARARDPNNPLPHPDHNSGISRITIPDPFRPGRTILVDAIYDPKRNRTIPLDPMYRLPGDEYALLEMFAMPFADTGVTAPGTAPPALPSNSSSSTLVLLLVGVLGVYALTR